MKQLFRFMNLVLVLFVIAPAAVGQESAAEPVDPEKFRADLLAYVEDLSRLSPAVVQRVYKDEFSLSEARATIEAYSHDELRMMEKSVSLVPFWREVPQMLAEKALTDGSVDTASLDAAAPPVTLDGEALRHPMLAFVNALRQMPPELVGAEYHQRIARVEGIINGADTQQLVELQAAFTKQMPVWMDATAKKRNGLRTETQSHCGNAFPASVICELNHVFDTIAAIPGQVATFATNAVNFIGSELKKLFETITEVIPTSPSGVMNLIGLGSPAYQSVVGNLPDLKPPCPTSVPGIGTVGDIQAMYVCQRGPEFLGRALFNIFPKDLWGMKPKIAAGLFYFPWTYLCGSCYGGQYERNEYTRATDHRTFLSTNLNVQASTVADQISVNNVQGQVTGPTGIDADVARTEGKLDVLTQKTDQQLVRLDVDVTTRASEASVDTGRLETRNVLDDVARAEGKLGQIDRDVVALLAEQGKTATSLAKFREAALRQRIEDDLSRQNGGDRIGLFVTPEAQGGFLELVIAIVRDTLEKRRAAGLDTRDAVKEFDKAQAEYASRKYKDAYTSLRKAYEKAVGS